MKYLRFIASFIFVTFIFRNFAFAETIEEFNSISRVESSGIVYVEERILFNTDGLSKHGIFRDIDYKKTNNDGKKYILDISDFNVTDESGNKHMFSISKNTNAGTISLKIGDPDTTYNGKKWYIIKYSVSGAITYFEDHDEFYWNFTGNKWDFPITSSKNLVILPTNVPKNEVNLICYTGSYGEVGTDCTSFTSDSGFEFHTTSILSYGEGISGTVGFPKNYVNVLLPEEDKPSLLFYILSTVVAFLGLSWYVFFPIRVLKKRTMFKAFFKKNKREVAAWFEPPAGKDKQPLTPAEVGVLIDKKPDQKEITATIIDLAKRGYFKIIKEEKEYFFNKEKDYVSDISLKSYEKLILDGIFEKADLVGTNSLKKSITFGENARDFLEQVVTALEKHGFFDGDLSDKKNANIALIVVSILTLNLFLFIVLIIYRKHYIKFSEKGIQAFSETKSLKNFLESQDAQLDFQAKNMMFFEKLLPYASAFGVEDVWIQKFKDLGQLETDWYQGELSDVSAFRGISNSIGRTASAAMTHYTSSTSSSGFSSGFSGGGFSGGGGGGGGGGSW